MTIRHKAIQFSFDGTTDSIGHTFPWPDSEKDQVDAFKRNFSVKKFNKKKLFFGDTGSMGRQKKSGWFQYHLVL